MASPATIGLCPMMLNEGSAYVYWSPKSLSRWMPTLTAAPSLSVNSLVQSSVLKVVSAYCIRISFVRSYRITCTLAAQPKLSWVTSKWHASRCTMKRKSPGSPRLSTRTTPQEDGSKSVQKGKSAAPIELPVVGIADHEAVLSEELN